MVAARVILSLALCCAPAAGVLPIRAWWGALRTVPHSETAAPVSGGSAEVAKPVPLKVDSNPLPLKGRKGRCKAVLPDAYSGVKEKAQDAYDFIALMARQNISDTDTGSSCLLMLQGIMNDPLRGPWLAETGVQAAVMAFLNHHKYNAELIYNMCFLIGGGYGVPGQVASRTDALGGFAYLFDQIQMHDDPNFQMQIYRALSDPSYTEAGARAIANVGGPSEGIKKLVNEMRAHPAPHLAESPVDHLSMKYEIMQVGCGLLSHDLGRKLADKVYAPHFMDAGFLDLVLHSMRAEFTLRGTNDVACKSLAAMVDDNAPAGAYVIRKGGMRLIRDAFEMFRDTDLTPLSWGHGTLGLEYPVIPNCIAALSELLKTNGENALDAMRKLDMLTVLRNVRPEFAEQTIPFQGVLIAIQPRSVWNKETMAWDPPATMAWDPPA